MFIDALLKEYFKSAASAGGLAFFLASTCFHRRKPEFEKCFFLFPIESTRVCAGPAHTDAGRELLEFIAAADALPILFPLPHFL